MKSPCTSEKNGFYRTEKNTLSDGNTSPAAHSRWDRPKSLMQDAAHLQIALAKTGNCANPENTPRFRSLHLFAGNVIYICVISQRSVQRTESCESTRHSRFG